MKKVISSVDYAKKQVPKLATTTGLGSMMSLTTWSSSSIVYEIKVMELNE